MGFDSPDETRRGGEREKAERESFLCWLEKEENQNETY